MRHDLLMRRVQQGVQRAAEDEISTALCEIACSPTAA
jgi:hypothetical protein